MALASATELAENRGCKTSSARLVALLARELLGSLSGLGHEQALSLLVDQVADSDADELRKLEALIRKRKKDLAG